MNGDTVFFIVWAIGVTSILTIFYIRGKKALSIFPDIQSVSVVYRDKSASGYSTESLITKLGGAQNVLDIVVTDQELWLKSRLIFAGIGRQSDLIHKIPLDNIVQAERQRRKVTLDFKTQDGEDKQLVLLTSRPDDFLKAINR